MKEKKRRTFNSAQTGNINDQALLKAECRPEEAPDKCVVHREVHTSGLTSEEANAVLESHSDARSSSCPLGSSSMHPHYPHPLGKPFGNPLGNQFGLSLGSRETPTVFDEHQCEVCSGNGVEARILKAFRMRICAKCKPTLHLITQTRAMSQYLVSKSDLNTLRSVEEPNPRSHLWHPMVLYREEEVRSISQRKYPDLEGEREKRSVQKKETRAKRIRRKVEALKRTLRRKINPCPDHVHAFSSTGICECGLEVEQEEI